MNSKAAQERLQRILMDLVRQPGNDVCADCKGRAPRWASWNLGIFICVQCAGVHRKMGVHISKVKSLTLDTWTREQVDRMKEMGNIKSNKIYNPDEMRNRPPTNMEESERDSELEKYIRRKYEFRRFVEGRPPPVPTKDATFLTSPPPSSSRFGSLRSPVEPSSSSLDQDNLAEGKSIARSRTAPIPGAWHEAQQRAKANAPPLPSAATSAFRSASGSAASAFSGATTSATASQSGLQAPGTAVPLRTSSALNTRNGNTAAATTTTGSKPATGSAQSSVFDDLISLSELTQPSAAQPPLQMNPWAAMQAQQQSVLSAPAIQEPTGNFWAGQGAISGASSPVTPFGVSPSNQVRSMPQHANTAPTLMIPSPQNQMNSQVTGLLSPGNGMMYSPYQQQTGAALGAMAFSTSPMASPSSATSNPFTMQANYAPSLPQANMTGVNGQYQPQQLGQVAFQGQAGAGFMNQQQQQQQISNPNGFNQFQTSMMPNDYGKSGQFGSPFMQQQQQHTQQGSPFGNMW